MAKPKKTTRQRVEALVREGYTNAEIAEKLGLGHTCTYNHAKDIRATIRRGDGIVFHRANAKYEWCNGCRNRVKKPCLLCQLRRMKDKEKSPCN